MKDSHFSPTPQAWRGAAVGVFLATLMLIGLSTIDLLRSNVSMGDASIYFVIGSLIAAVFGGLLVFLSVLSAQIPTPLKWAIACFAVCAYYFFTLKQSTVGLLVIGIWTITSFSLACGSLWSLLTNKSENKNRLSTLIYFFLGLFGIAVLLFWLNAFQSLSLPTTLEGKRQVQSIELPDPALAGNFAVKTLSYGNIKDFRPEYGKNATIHTEILNGSPFIHSWNGLSGWLRTRYWGFDSKKIPLNGQVWYPEGNGPFPLILIVHGNHEMSVPSEDGYAYLAALWASRGFIVVSIDQNFLNGGWIDFTGSLNEVSARGWLILEHLNLWREWNDSDSLFANKVDLKKIALVGHSRGGEAIATAAALNDLDYYPDNGNIPFDYHFNIRALAAISPVDAQYYPGGKKTRLKNINYFVIHGAHDGDVRSFQGNGQYNRVRFSDSDYHFKAALYIFGANHTRFNTEWGTKDIESPGNLFFNPKQFLSEHEQQQIAKVYLTAFLEAALNNQEGYLPLFHNWRTGQLWLPKTIYFNEFSDSNEWVILNSNKTIALGKTTIPGGTIKGDHLKTWLQKKVELREKQSYLTGIFLGWDTSSVSETPSYTITLPKKHPQIDNKSVLVLSLADSNDNEEESEEQNKTGQPIDFTIELIDSSGKAASLPLSTDAFLQPVVKAPLMVNRFLDPLNPSESVFQTFELPLKEFIAANPLFDPASLQTIRLLFDKTSSGLIIVNYISIRNQDPQNKQ